MKILIADSNQGNTKLLEAILAGKGYEVIKARNGEDVLKILEKGNIDLILLDIMIPGFSGFELARRIKEKKQIPLVLITDSREKEDIIEGFHSGVDEYLFKPFVKEELLVRIKNILKVREYQDTLEGVIREKTESLRKVLQKLNTANKEVMHRLLVAAEYRDDDTGRHVTRVGKYSRIIAEGLGLDGDYLDLIEQAAPMHDIGKIGVSDLILHKPGELTFEEFEIMKSHVIIGMRILEKSESPLIEIASDIILNHHERWDGKGYPNGLRGNDIPLSGRIVALADVFDAITTRRPYKPAFSWDESIRIINEEKGRHFDPAVVNAFLNSHAEIRNVYMEFADEVDIRKVTAE